MSVDRFPMKSTSGCPPCETPNTWRICMLVRCGSSLYAAEGELRRHPALAYVFRSSGNDQLRTEAGKRADLPALTVRRQESHPIDVGFRQAFQVLANRGSPDRSLACLRTLRRRDPARHTALSSRVRLERPSPNHRLKGAPIPRVGVSPCAYGRVDKCTPVCAWVAVQLASSFNVSSLVEPGFVV